MRRRWATRKLCRCAPSPLRLPRPAPLVFPSTPFALAHAHAHAHAHTHAHAHAHAHATTTATAASPGALPPRADLEPLPETGFEPESRRPDARALSSRRRVWWRSSCSSADSSSGWPRQAWGRHRAQTRTTRVALPERQFRRLCVCYMHTCMHMYRTKSVYVHAIRPLSERSEGRRVTDTEALFFQADTRPHSSPVAVRSRAFTLSYKLQHPPCTGYCVFRRAA